MRITSAVPTWLAVSGGRYSPRPSPLMAAHRWVLWNPPVRTNRAVFHRALLALTSGGLMYEVPRDVKQMEKGDRKRVEPRSFLLPLLKWAEEAASPRLCCPQKDPGFGCQLVAVPCTAPDRCWSFRPVRALADVRVFLFQMSLKKPHQIHLPTPPFSMKSRRWKDMLAEISFFI